MYAVIASEEFKSLETSGAKDDSEAVMTRTGCRVTTTSQVRVAAVVAARLDTAVVVAAWARAAVIVAAR